MGKKASRPVSWKKGALLGGVSVLALLISLELIFRWLSPSLLKPFYADRVSSDERRASPYTMFSKFDYRYVPYSAPENEVRIFVLGGSTVAQGLPPLPELLDADLRRRGLENGRVFNYGSVSQRSGQELAQLVFHVLDRRPDMVIMYDGGNDVLDHFSSDPRPGYPFNFAFYEKNPVFAPVDRYPWAAATLFGSALCRHLFRDYFYEQFAGFRELRDRAGHGTDSWRGEIAKIYVGNIRKAQTFSKAFGADFFCFFQPIISFKDPLHPDEERHFHGDQSDHALKMRELIRAEFGKMDGTGGVVDVSDLFDGAPGPVFRDAIHVIDGHNPVVAKAIGGHIERTLRRRPSARWRPQ